MRKFKIIAWIVSLLIIAVFVFIMSKVEYHVIRGIIGNECLPGISYVVYRFSWVGFLMLGFPVVYIALCVSQKTEGAFMVCVLVSSLLMLLWVFIAILAWRLPYMHMYGPMTPTWQ